MESPSVTVLTAVRNGAPHIAETIESIRAQTFSDWEYLIVDDGSDDGTPGIVDEAADRDHRIRLIRRDESGGPYAAANTGLAEARGRFVVRLDADDLALPHRIERQIDYLEQTGLRACASMWLRKMASGELLEGVPNVSWGVRALKWRLCVRPQFVHSTACVERSALEEIGGYRELRLSQDLRMWCEFARRHWLGVVPEVLVYFRRPGGLTASSAELQEQLAIDILKEHLEALSARVWTTDEVRALRPEWSGVPIGRRLGALKRWAHSWRADQSLGPTERRELARLTRDVRLRLTKQTLRREGLSVATLWETLTRSRRSLRAG